MMLKNKLVVVGFCFVVLGLTVFFFVGQKEKRAAIDSQNKKPLKIGYITDLHCYSKLDSGTNKWEINWRCSQPIANFTRIMRDDFQPHVIVEGGDLVDGRDDQEKNLYPVVLKFFEKMSAPAYHLLGNHETRGFSKEEWLDFTDYEKPYYYIDAEEDYRLIFLDGNNKPGENGEAVETSPDLHYYPGFLGREQESWLEELLKKSENKTILVFVHQPPLEKTLLKESKELFVEGERLRNLFSEHKVKAVFSGHIEEMCYIEDDGVQYYALEGVHKDNRQLLRSDDYKDQGTFYEIIIKENGEMEVKMFFKDKEDDEYQNLIVDSELYT